LKPAENFSAGISYLAYSSYAGASFACSGSTAFSFSLACSGSSAFYPSSCFLEANLKNYLYLSFVLF